MNPSPPDRGVVTLAQVREAAGRIAPYAHRTPVLTCESLSRMAGARLFFKAEHLQRVGAFKFRGACNTVFSLSAAEAQRGVATHSSGNHAAAVALSARLRGIDAHIVMPQNAPAVKKAAVAGYGGRIVFCAPTQEARETTLAQVVEETGAEFIHPYDDPRVIAGQGTAALELLEEVPELDVVITPVGGGGLLSGTAITVTELSGGRTAVLGAEPAGADDAYRSLRDGRLYPSAPETVCDALLTSLSERTFGILRERVEAILRVEDADAIKAMRHVWERMKQVIEVSSAVPLAAVLTHPERFSGRRVGIVLSGGNVDLQRLPWSAAG